MQHPSQQYWSLVLCTSGSKKKITNNSRKGDFYYAEQILTTEQLTTIQTITEDSL